MRQVYIPPGTQVKSRFFCSLKSSPVELPVIIKSDMDPLALIRAAGKACSQDKK